MQTPNSPTTQAWSQTSAVTGALAATVAAAAPAPWGQIVAGILGAISVIAGIVAHSTISKNSAQQVVNAVNTGLQAASQTLTPSNTVSPPLLK
jgi:Na+/glutamate symporter